MRTGKLIYIVPKFNLSAIGCQLSLICGQKDFCIGGNYSIIKLFIITLITIFESKNPTNKSRTFAKIS